jgi:ABC-type nitrate/sulfonate/bicarbonate transport system substrate-binding protein
VKLAIISEGFHMWPLYVAHARRFFEREGLDVETTLTGASAKQLEALVRGDFDIGPDLFIFMANAPQPDLNLVVAPGIRTFEDLRGRTVAVDGARSGYALLQSRLLVQKGLKEGDYAVLEAGGVKGRFDALQTGTAVASWLNPPYDEWLFAAGFGTLGSVAHFFPGYPGSIAAARRSWASANPERLIAFIRAFMAAYAWMLEAGNRQETEDIARARLGTDPTQTAAAYVAFTSKPRADVTVEALQQVIDAVWDAERYTQPKGAPGKYMDLSYLARAQGA